MREEKGKFGAFGYAEEGEQQKLSIGGRIGKTTAMALRGVAGAIDPLVPVPAEGAGGSMSRHEPDSFSRAELEEYLDEYASMEQQALAMELEKQRAEKMLAELEASKAALEAQVTEIEAERREVSVGY